MMKFFACLFCGLLFAGAAKATSSPEPSSVCHGTTANGSLENGWKLPGSGVNYSAYSSVGVLAGRTYVHSTVYGVIISAYKNLEVSAPGKQFVYGETGLEGGGPFKPHKTHQNGLSVDFFVPVLNSKNGSVELPISPLNKFGYNIEFDQHGRYKDYTIDFDALAKHLIELKRSADAADVGIRVVILDNGFQKLLRSSPSGRHLPKDLNFSRTKPWVRHDEHYHVDFMVRCKK